LSKVFLDADSTLTALRLSGIKDNPCPKLSLSGLVLLYLDVLRPRTVSFFDVQEPLNCRDTIQVRSLLLSSSSRGGESKYTCEIRAVTTFTTRQRIFLSSNLLLLGSSNNPHFILDATHRPSSLVAGRVTNVSLLTHEQAFYRIKLDLLGEQHLQSTLWPGLKAQPNILSP
jgi:hypothetical protein